MTLSNTIKFRFPNITAGYLGIKNGKRTGALGASLIRDAAGLKPANDLYATKKISRSNLYYQHKMPVKDALVIEAMKNLSGIYPQFGSRRIRIFLQREGIHVGKERCGRLWEKADLQCLKNGAESALEHRCGRLYRWHVTGVMISCMMRVLTDKN